jgi:hypothetical protein
MVWVLFIRSDKDFKDIEFTFSNGYGYRYNNSSDKTFRLSDYSSWNDIQLNIIETMNLNVALRQAVYIVCDIRLGVYEYLHDKMSMLFFRTSGVIDLQSFLILNDIKTQETQETENIDLSA